MKKIEQTYLGIVGPPENQWNENETTHRSSHLPNSALPNTGKYRRAMRTDIQITQQMEKTSTLNERSPAFTVKGRF